MTCVQWWWSQVSGTQIETFSPVTVPWRSGRLPQLLEMKKNNPTPCSICSIHPTVYNSAIGFKVNVSRSSYIQSEKVAATAKKIYMGEEVSAVKSISKEHALWLITLGEGFGRRQYRYCWYLCLLYFIIYFFKGKLRPALREVLCAISHHMNLCQVIRSLRFWFHPSLFTNQELTLW